MQVKWIGGGMIKSQKIADMVIAAAKAERISKPGHYEIRHRGYKFDLDILDNGSIALRSYIF